MPRLSQPRDTYHGHCVSIPSESYATGEGVHVVGSDGYIYNSWSQRGGFSVRVIGHWKQHKEIAIGVPLETCVVTVGGDGWSPSCK